MLACHSAISRKSLFNSLLKEKQGRIFLSRRGNVDGEHLSGLQGSSTRVVWGMWLGELWNACWSARAGSILVFRFSQVCGGGWRRRGSRGDYSSAAAKLATCRSADFRIPFSSGLQYSSLLAQPVSGQKTWLKATTSERRHQGGGLKWVPAVGKKGSCRGFRGRRIQHFFLNAYLCQQLSNLYHFVFLYLILYINKVKWGEFSPQHYVLTLLFHRKWRCG